MLYTILRLMIVYLTIGLVNALFTLVVVYIMCVNKQGFLDLAKDIGYESEVFTMSNLEDLDYAFHTDTIYIGKRMLIDTILWPGTIIRFIKIRINKSKLVHKKES